MRVLPVLLPDHRGFLQQSPNLPDTQWLGLIERRVQALELKIPPLLVALIMAAVMWAIAPLGPLLTSVAPYILKGAAVAIAAAGLAVAIAGVVSFRRAKTTISPLKPETSTALVTSGIYAVTRNPVYLGMLLVLVGWAVYLGSPLALAGPLVFALYIQRFQILPEERALSSLFGSAYTEYKSRVRRWL
jgi:protein-S-isoprenylcysteine O-methyltransferase Ste14